MNLVGSVQSAISGWFDIFAGRPGWRDRFDFNAVGLVGALVVYGFVALASIFAGAVYGLPSPLQLIAKLLLMALPLVAVTIAVFATRAMLGLTADPLEMIIPAIYIFAVYVLIASAFSFIGPVLNPILLVLAGVVMFRQARVVANLSVTISVAFALLTVVLLVALPASLYMLMAPGNGPI